MVKLKSTKPRSKRLRKKLHVDEFKENYVHIYFKIRKSVADSMDVEAWCDFHDLLFDIIQEQGAEPGCGSSCDNDIEFSFTQFANQPDLTDAVVAAIREKVDVYLDSIYVSPAFDAYNWQGWDLDDPFDLIYSYSYLST